MDTVYIVYILYVLCGLIIINIRDTLKGAKAPSVGCSSCLGFRLQCLDFFSKPPFLSFHYFLGAESSTLWFYELGPPSWIPMAWLSFISSPLLLKGGELAAEQRRHNARGGYAPALPHRGQVPDPATTSQALMPQARLRLPFPATCNTVCQGHLGPGRGPSTSFLWTRWKSATYWTDNTSASTGSEVFPSGWWIAKGIIYTVIPNLTCGLTYDTDNLAPCKPKYRMDQRTRHQSSLLQMVTGTLLSYAHMRKRTNQA